MNEWLGGACLLARCDALAALLANAVRWHLFFPPFGFHLVPFFLFSVIFSGCVFYMNEVAV